MNEKRYIVHLITGLGKGGAETMLYQILRYRSDKALAYRVVSLGLSHYYENKIEKLGFSVTLLDLKRHPLKALYQLHDCIKCADVLCCWMYYCNLLGYIFGRKEKTTKIVWCIRHSDLSRNKNRRVILFVNKICAKLSKNVSAITYNGILAQKVHEDAGYDKKCSIVLENGCDLIYYSYKGKYRRQIRSELKISDDKIVILSIARNSLIKDLPNFIKAFSVIHHKKKNTVAIMCGSGIDHTNMELRLLCKAENIEYNKDILFLGFCENIHELLSAADFYVLHSAGEAFPNTLIQAMACECIPICTDVGDVERILGNREMMVPPGNHKALAEKILYALELSDEKKRALKRENRKRVSEKYDIKKIVKKYEEILRAVNDI